MFTHYLHNKLTNRYSWYQKYHQWEHHHKVHWAVLAMYVLSVVSFGLASLSQAPKAQATDTQINLAAGTITASTDEAGKGNVVDGSYAVTSRWGGSSSPPSAAWWKVDLGSNYTISKFQDGDGGITGRGSPYYIDTSVDDNSYTNQTYMTAGTYTPPANITARYIKLRVNLSMVGDYIVEFSAYQPASDPPPTISISSPSNNCAGGKHYTRSGSVTVSGTAADTAPGTVSSVTVNGGAATGTTSWSKSGVSLPSEGDNTITAIATDNSSQTSNPASITVYKDTTAPTVTISSPAEGTVTSSSTATISGSAYDNSGGSGLTSVSSSTGSSVSGTSSWSTTVNLSAGSNTITITATDCAGNTGTQSVGIVYQDGTGGGDPDPDTAKSITVTAPNGGENYLTGVGTGALSSTTITWTTQNISASEKIKLSYATNNSTYTTIADNEGNDGSYSWTLPVTKSTSVKVKAELTTDASVADTSDNTLTLHSNSAPVLSL